jgi:hypothetical protein
VLLSRSCPRLVVGAKSLVLRRLASANGCSYIAARVLAVVCGRRSGVVKPMASRAGLGTAESHCLAVLAVDHPVLLTALDR